MSQDLLEAGFCLPLPAVAKNLLNVSKSLVSESAACRVPLILLYVEVLLVVFLSSFSTSKCCRFDFSESPATPKCCRFDFSESPVTPKCCRFDFSESPVTPKCCRFDFSESLATSNYCQFFFSKSLSMLVCSLKALLYDKALSICFLETLLYIGTLSVCFLGISIHADMLSMANRRVDVLIRLLQEWRNDEGDFAQDLEHMRAAMEGWLREIVGYAFGEHTEQILACVMVLQELLDWIEARLRLLQTRTEGRWEQIRDAAYELHYNHREPNEESVGSVNNPGGEVTSESSV
ncbi:hypothetical protein Taro_056514 [Colocasia esculenta]|uniref:Uncharacterized protein n=1 Tax=Colocasia esculenta TaxID=4460 RepID=A0A843XWW7_COLES|nr:hypothetical protein [Colocasia esculenta]